MCCKTEEVGILVDSGALLPVAEWGEKKQDGEKGDSQETQVCQVLVA